MTFCKGYGNCVAPPTCYRHYDPVNDCIYQDHTPNTKKITIKPYAPTSFGCPDGTIQSGVNYVVACTNHGLTSSKPRGWQCPDGTTQYGTSAKVACQGHMLTKFYCPDGTYQLGNNVQTACKGHDTITVLNPLNTFPKTTTKITSNTLPTSKSQLSTLTTNSLINKNTFSTSKSQLSALTANSLINKASSTSIYEMILSYKYYIIAFLTVIIIIALIIRSK